MYIKAWLNYCPFNCSASLNRLGDFQEHYYKKHDFVLHLDLTPGEKDLLIIAKVSVKMSDLLQLPNHFMIAGIRKTRLYRHSLEDASSSSELIACALGGPSTRIHFHIVVLEILWDLSPTIGFNLCDGHSYNHIGHPDDVVLLASSTACWTHTF